MTLADRMRQAADTLEEVSVLYDYRYNPECAEWSAEKLRHEAGMVEDDELG